MLIKLIRQHMRPYKRLIWLLLGFQAVQTVAGLVLPQLNADIINKGILGRDNPYIVKTGAVMLVFAVIQMGFNIAGVYFGGRVAMGFARDIRNNLFHRVTGFSHKEVAAVGAPSLITRITNDVQQIQMLVVMVCTMAVTAPMTMGFGLIMALRLDMGLSVILLVSIPLTMVILGSIVAGMVPAFTVMQERIDQINRVLREQITGIRVVRAFVREREETRRFAQVNGEVTDAALRSGRLMSAMFPTINVLTNLSSVAVLWIGADRVGAGTAEVGTIVAYLSYLMQILMSVMMATFMVSMIPRASVAAGRVMEVLHTETSVLRAATPKTPTTTGEVEFRGAGFHYPGAEQSVLDNISFVTKRGQTTAIVGSSGAGKTTLVNLVARLFDVTSGQVLVDGVDVRELEMHALSDRIGLVPQKPFLFSGTVASNLRFGKPDATEAEMWEALRVAQAEDFVRAMPGGLGARIEQGGSNVSGGQRQRLSIARALIRRPEIFVFDDSFSALDLTTDAKLRAALPAFTADAAVLIVAQRVSTISTADQIIVLDDGKLIGQGTHDELLAGCPTYAEIVQSQIGEKEVAA